MIPAGGTHYVLSNITLVPPDSHTPTADVGSTATLLMEAITAYQLDDSADALSGPGGLSITDGIATKDRSRQERDHDSI